MINHRECRLVPGSYDQWGIRERIGRVVCICWLSAVLRLATLVREQQVHRGTSLILFQSSMEEVFGHTQYFRGSPDDEDRGRDFDVGLSKALYSKQDIETLGDGCM